MLAKQVSVRELFPTARELFAAPQAKARRVSVPLLAWLIVGAIIALAGQRIVRWIDRNL